MRYFSIGKLILLSSTVFTMKFYLGVANAAPAAGYSSQNPPVAHAARHATKGKQAAPAGTSTTATPTGMVARSQPEEMRVRSSVHRSSGGGLLAVSNDVKSSVTTSRAYILTQPATTNPQRLLALQPGAVVAAQDPYGIEPGNLTVRGLNNNEIIWLYEDAPITNDGTFFPNEAVDSLNLEQVSLSPGSTNFDLPGSNGAAGSIKMSLHNPSHKMGGFANVTYGQYNTRQVFGRFETGDIGNTGLRAFVSYSNFLGDDWRGPGKNWREHVDSKFVKDWKDGSQTSLAVEWTRLNFQLERPPSLSAWNAQGKNYNYTSNFTPGDTNYYKLHQNVYDGMFATLEHKLVVNRNLSFKINPYFYYARAAPPGGINVNPNSAYMGVGAENKITGLQLNGSGSGSQTLYSSAPAIFERSGINASMDWKIGRHHRITFGDWYAFTEQSSEGQLNYLDSTGNPKSLWGGKGSAVYLPNGDLYRTSNVLNRVQTDQIYLGDHMQFLHGKLALEAGFKYLFFRAQNFNRIPGMTYNVNNNQTAPMPSLGARYSINDANQVFFDAGVNSRVPDPSQIADSLNISTGKFSGRASRDQKIETSIIEELGYRHNDKWVTAQFTLFNYNFTNRQISTVVTQNAALVTQYVNAGGQTTKGIDGSIGTHPFHHFSLFLSGEYLDTKIGNNLSYNNVILPTKGKHATGAPTWTGNISLSYDDSRFFGNIQMHYVASQYSTFMNDQKIPGYKTVDMSLGYRFRDMGPVKTPKLQLNLQNLTNNHYLAGIYSTQFTAHSYNGAAAQTPLYIVGGGFAAMFSASAAM